jgi:hypothetical protein
VSYLHCPTCQRAYNVANRPACPHCGVRVDGTAPGQGQALAVETPADPVADVIAAAEQLARAVERTTPAQLAAARAELDRRGPRHVLAAVPMIEPVVTGRARQALLTTVVLALLTRVSRQPVIRRAARALLGT